MTKVELETEIAFLKRQNTIMWNALVALKRSAGDAIAQGNTTNPAYVLHVTCEAITKIEFMRDQIKGNN